MYLNRRAFVHLIAGLLASVSLPKLFHGSAHAQTAAPAKDEKAWRHGLSLFGDLKYPEGFKHFGYVNPAAPKGGHVPMGAWQL